MEQPHLVDTHWYPWGQEVKVNVYPQWMARNLSGYPEGYLIKILYPQPPPVQIKSGRAHLHIPCNTEQKVKMCS